jgi:cobalt/nickel transport system permease protein
MTMAGIAGTFSELNFLDELSTGETFAHRLDPRAKLLTVLVFIVAVVSFDRYRISGLLPFFFFPAGMIPLAEIPARYLLKKLLFLLPFAVLVGIFNPLFDRQPMIALGPVVLSGGMVSFLSILLRFSLTVLAAFILIAMTGFSGVCLALERFRVPRVFCVQLMLLHRYIFVLSDEAARMSRAREMRSSGRRGMGIRVFGSLVGHLLLRTWERAQRVHMAMLGRGFTGEFHIRRPLTLTWADALFTLAWCALFVLFRFVDLPRAAGLLFTGGAG